MAQQSSFSDIPGLLSKWYGNFTRNTSQAFSRMTAKDYIRLIIVAGAYMLLIRPFLVKMGMRVQAKQHEQANKEVDNNARLNANDLRGKIAIPGVDSDSEDETGTKSDVKTGEWGRKARLRQRRVVRKAIEIKERAAAADDESDEEIKQFLEDN
jgi:Protein trafficking PGA2